MPSVYVEYFARLGNQLFQYATAYSLAKRLGYELVHVDALYEATCRGEKPPIHQFGISGRTPSTWESLLIYLTTARTAGKLCRPLRPFLPQLLRDRELGWDARLAEVKRSVYLRGYWQSYLYFQHDTADIVEHFRPRGAPSVECAATAVTLRSPGTVAIHVRRGDYVSHPEYSKAFVSHGNDYYRHGFDILRRFGAIDRVMVFSDEPDWCRHHLKFDAPIELAPPSAKGDWEHLWLMSQATRMIIAASSFSWWAGWLSHSRGGHVVAPRIWRRGTTSPPSDLLPPEWLLVE